MNTDVYSFKINMLYLTNSIADYHFMVIFSFETICNILILFPILINLQLKIFFNKFKKNKIDTLV